MLCDIVFIDLYYFILYGVFLYVFIDLHFTVGQIGGRDPFPVSREEFAPQKTAILGGIGGEGMFYRLRNIFFPVFRSRKALCHAPNREGSAPVEDEGRVAACGVSSTLRVHTLRFPCPLVLFCHVPSLSACL